jgi:hypothetical protein
LNGPFVDGKTIMFSSNLHEQTIIEISQRDYAAITVDSFLIDRQAGGVSKYTIKFYWHLFNLFIKYCNANSLKLIGEITPDFCNDSFSPMQKCITLDVSMLLKES